MKNLKTILAIPGLFLAIPLLIIVALVGSFIFCGGLVFFMIFFAEYANFIIPYILYPLGGLFILAGLLFFAYRKFIKKDW